MRKKRKCVLQSYLSEEEYDEIIQSSQRAGLSVSTFARRVCLGSKVESREDAQARRELLKINADLSRLGGLLKQTITATGNREGIRPLLIDIANTQAELKAKVQEL